MPNPLPSLSSYALGYCVMGSEHEEDRLDSCSLERVPVVTCGVAWWIVSQPKDFCCRDEDLGAAIIVDNNTLLALKLDR